MCCSYAGNTKIFNTIYALKEKKDLHQKRWYAQKEKIILARYINLNTFISADLGNLLQFSYCRNHLQGADGQYYCMIFHTFNMGLSQEFLQLLQLSYGIEHPYGTNIKIAEAIRSWHCV